MAADTVSGAPFVAFGSTGVHGKESTDPRKGEGFLGVRSTDGLIFASSAADPVSGAADPFSAVGGREAAGADGAEGCLRILASIAALPVRGAGAA